MPGTVPSYVLEGVASIIENAGHDPVDLAERVGLNPAALYESDILINEASVNDFFEEASIVCTDRFFGLKVSEIKGLDAVGPLWLLARNANTIGEVIKLMADNMAMHTQSLIIDLTEDDDAGILLSVEVSLHSKSGSHASAKTNSITQMVELTLALFTKLLRSALGSDWVPEYSQFRHAAPCDTQPLKKVFGEHLFFNQDVNAIHVRSTELQAPNNQNSGNGISIEAQKVAERDLESSVGQSMTFVQRVSRIIRMLINDDGVSATDVATALDIPVRTLQYRLKKHNTSYQALYDHAREELAKHYLSKSSLSISAIAERLHFNDTAALSNFFKGRVGHSPREYTHKKTRQP